MITANLPILNLGLQYLDQGIFMSDLISSNPAINNTSSTPKTTGPRESQTTQASEAQASSPAQLPKMRFEVVVSSEKSPESTLYERSTKEWLDSCKKIMLAV